MARQINATMSDKDPVVFCVMNGGVIPTGHLLPRLTFPFRMDYLHATRYREKTTGDELHWLKTSDIDLDERNVLIVDDILDEGYTLKAIVDYCQHQGAKEVYTAVLADKQHNRGCGFKADFVGLEIIDRYVFGMGMDYKGYLRHLPAIYAVKGM
jgi:hypoxanthine phosphoribosyltransferase